MRLVRGEFGLGGEAGGDFEAGSGRWIGQEFAEADPVGGEPAAGDLFGVEDFDLADAVAVFHELVEGAGLDGEGRGVGEVEAGGLELGAVPDGDGDEAAAGGFLVAAEVLVDGQGAEMGGGAG